MQKTLAKFSFFEPSPNPNTSYLKFSSAHYPTTSSLRHLLGFFIAEILGSSIKNFENSCRQISTNFFTLAFFLLLFSFHCVYAAESGLPFTEDFSSDTLIDRRKTTADLSTEEQAVRLAWAKRRYGAWGDPPIIDNFCDINTFCNQDKTLAIAIDDIDGDGDLDLVSGNDGVNRVYLNTGLKEAPFSDAFGFNISEDNHLTTSVALGDVDGDGDLDVITGNRITPNRLYLNNGNENPFENVTGLNISEDNHLTTSVALGDVDGDGDLDVITGNSNTPNRLYLNNGSENPFENVNGNNISDDDNETFSLTLGDLDGDGDLDVIAGNRNKPNSLYLNNGSENPFKNVTGTNISDDAAFTASIALGDIDGDGDLDVVVGNRKFGRFDKGFNRLYLNNGSENPFANVNGLFISVDNGDTHSVALGDIDSDGDLDVVAGNSLMDSVATFDRGAPNRLYLNNGTANPFANINGINLSENDDETLSIALGDIDGDGDLDVVAGNNDFEGAPNRVYMNSSAGNPFVNSNGLSISNDDDSTFSIALGDVDSDGNDDVVVGNTGTNRLYLHNGTANPFINVTGINISEDADNTSSIALGDMDGDGNLDVVTGNDVGTNRLYLNNGTKNPFANVSGFNISDDEHATTSIELGDIDGDGDLDVIAGNSGLEGAANRYYLNNGSENPFANVNGTNISDDGHDTQSIALGDMDGDGDLDVVAGNFFASGNVPNRLYLNNGSEDPFANVNGTNITNDVGTTASIALGDVDGDGDLDVVTGNFTVTNIPNRLYLNNGSENPFLNVIGTNISRDINTTTSVSLGDVDGDGDLDLVAGNLEANRLYLNNGSQNPFTNVIGVTITNDTIDTESITLGDVDGDGDLDAVAGNRGLNRLYLNNGSANPFININGVTITNDTDDTGSIALGDVDSDGDLDVVAGNSFDDGPYTLDRGSPNHLYLNNGSENPFDNINGIKISNDEDETRSIALGDMDGDGDLDVITGNANAPNRLYLNNGTESPFANAEGVAISDGADETRSIAVGDMDGDGDLDVVTGNANALNRLFLNNGTDNPFLNVSELNFSDDAHSTTSIALGDVDGDGDLDVVAGNNKAPIILYLNNGTGNPFENVNGLNISDDNERTHSINLGDVNGDGDLDIVVGKSGINRLYLNNGSENPFANVEGLNVSDHVDTTTSIALGDVDGDGDLDIVAGNTRGNRLYFNNGSENPFVSETGATITQFPDSSAAIAVADVNDDGLIDVVTGNSSGPNYVYFLYSHRLEAKEGGYLKHLGTVISETIDDRLEIIHSATLTATADIPSAASINFYLSNDGGQNWHLVQSEEPFLFPKTGSDLRWRTELHSLSPAVTPILQKITITANSAPDGIILCGKTVTENTNGGTEVGKLIGLDIDNETSVSMQENNLCEEVDTLPETHSFTLVEGFGSEDNSQFMIDRNVLKTRAETESESPATFDFEEKKNYTIRIQAEDEKGGKFDKNFSIIVTDANDSPTAISLSDNSVEENKEIRRQVGILTATDPDAEDQLVFSLVQVEGNDDHLFFDVINREESTREAILITKAKFDFETKNEYLIRVKASDKGNESKEEEFTITIDNEVDNSMIRDDDLILSSTEFGFGKGLTMTTKVSSDAEGPLNGPTEFTFCGPEGCHEIIRVLSSENGEVPIVSFVPDTAGKWTLTVDWKGNEDFDPTPTKEVTFTVTKSQSILEIFYLDVIQVLGQPRTIPGRLRIANGNPARVDLSGRDIDVSITGPSGQEGNFQAKTDRRGNFTVSIPDAFFDEEGDWNVEASFAGDNDLFPDDIGADETIVVRKKAGYAILVHGSVSSKEGVEEHLNTINYVHDVFEAAGFDTDPVTGDIKSVAFDISNPKASLKEAIEEWATDKILSGPAPLYVVFINHGSPERFHMHPDLLTAAGVDGLEHMLNTLQNGLVENDLANQQKIIVVLGMCFSGSFIPVLSGENRIIISASAHDEFSVRGPGAAGERQGEQFVYQLFRELSTGESLLDSFRKSRSAIRALSSNRNLAVNSDNPSFSTELGQHPLLDDNGDGIGSTLVSELSGDGQIAATIALTSPTNALLGLEIARKSPIRFLHPLSQNSDLPVLWAEVNEEPEDVQSIFMEVKRLNDTSALIEGSTMQHVLDLVREPMDFIVEGTAVRGTWPRQGIEDPNPNNLFTDFGAYQIFYLVQSADTLAELSDPAISYVYRASGDSAPAKVVLVAPGPGVTVNYIPGPPEGSDGLFRWSAGRSEFPPISYIFRLWQIDNENKKRLFFESEPLLSTSFYLPPELVEDGASYTWDVVAVDSRGNATSSDASEFKVDIPNNTPGRVKGIVWGIKSTTDKTLLTNAIIKEKNSAREIPTDINGEYEIVLLPDAYEFYASAPLHKPSETVAVTVNQGGVEFLDFELEPDVPKYSLTVESEFGDPQGAGEYLEGTKAEWSVTSPWPSDEGDNGVRYVAMGATFGEMDMIKDESIEIIWREEFLLTIDSERGEPQGGGWYESGSDALWSVISPVVITPNQHRYLADLAQRTESMTEPKHITINWTEQWKLAINSTTGGTVDTDGGWYNDESTVTIQATPIAGYHFVRWAGDVAEGQEEQNSITLTMNQKYVLTAVFARENTKPTASNSIPDQKTTKELFFSYTFPNDSFTDIDNDQLIYEVKLIDGEPISSLGLAVDAQSKTISGRPSVAGTYQIKVTVTDPHLETASDTFSIQVEDIIQPGNHKPVANAALFVVPKGLSISGNLSANDEDANDELVYEIITDPAQGRVVVTNANVGEFTYTSDPESEFTDTFQFRVNDSKENSEPATVTIQIDADVVTVALEKGWNSIGVENDYWIPDSSLINSQIWRWENQRFETVPFKELDGSQRQPFLKKGYGYWLFAKEDSMLILRKAAPEIVP